ncbi:hypothetical protein SAMN02745121_02766 [Nannocystis exedens]|uniref:Uncharacterized protein n=1 Tax=Nannocystis exedens TaxID=54 RepID=A0A1I1X763_9BACT|nr:hypothetical protein NAEX_03832 [Nannocystis exedens]SFE03219.1 hypothetical protein SAMN02745121_02766 [Nannocystis exedens]
MPGVVGYGIAAEAAEKTFWNFKRPPTVSKCAMAVTPSPTKPKKSESAHIRFGRYIRMSDGMCGLKAKRPGMLDVARALDIARRHEFS